MSRGTGGWSIILCGLLVCAEGARGQAPPAEPPPVRAPRAGLGIPDATDAGPSPALPPALITDLILEPGPPPEGGKTVPAAAQEKANPDDPEDIFSILVQLQPPGPQRLFRLESEVELFDRIRTERRSIRLPMQLPPIDDRTPTRVPTQRLWSTLTAVAEPGYLCYRRHSFEQRNFERYGWDLGVLTPPISAARFYADVLLLPVYWTLDPCRWYECSSGMCLPGDPTPLMWYRWRIK